MDHIPTPVPALLVCVRDHAQRVRGAHHALHGERDPGLVRAFRPGGDWRAPCSYVIRIPSLI